MATLFLINLRGISEPFETGMSKHWAAYIYLVVGNSYKMEILIWWIYSVYSSIIGTILKSSVNKIIKIELITDFSRTLSLYM